MSRQGYFALKRVADIVLSAVVLVLFAPILLVVGLLVRATSPGPALYRAKRVGKGHREFSMLKFRTMVVNADKVGPVVTAGDDPRITRLGKVLRLTKLDEIPQFYNVLRGDMSIIGPRPNVPSLIAGYSPEDQVILSVPQGITDYASLWFRLQEELLDGSGDVMADYETRVAPTKLHLGRYYATHGSMIADAKIFVATFLAVFFKVNPTWCFPAEIVPQTASFAGEQAAHELAA